MVEPLGLIPISVKSNNEQKLVKEAFTKLKAP